MVLANLAASQIAKRVPPCRRVRIALTDTLCRGYPAQRVAQIVRRAPLRLHVHFVALAISSLVARVNPVVPIVATVQHRLLVPLAPWVFFLAMARACPVVPVVKRALRQLSALRVCHSLDMFLPMARAHRVVPVVQRVCRRLNVRRACPAITFLVELVSSLPKHQFSSYAPAIAVAVIVSWAQYSRSTSVTAHNPPSAASTA